MARTPLSDPPGQELLGKSSRLEKLTFIYSREFRGWACNNCEWRFAVDPNQVFTDARAEEVVTLFDGHRCGKRARAGARAHAAVERCEVPMSKTSATAEWVLPMLLWIAMVGIFVSLVVAALSSATG